MHDSDYIHTFFSVFAKYNKKSDLLSNIAPKYRKYYNLIVLFKRLAKKFPWDVTTFKIMTRKLAIAKQMAGCRSLTTRRRDVPLDSCRPNPWSLILNSIVHFLLKQCVLLVRTTPNTSFKQQSNHLSSIDPLITSILFNKLLYSLI